MRNRSINQEISDIQMKCRIYKISTAVLAILLICVAGISIVLKHEATEMDKKYNELHWAYDDMRAQYDEFLIQEETQNPDQLHSGAEKFSEVPLEPAVVQYIYDSAITNGFKPEIIFAMAEKESQFDPSVTSRTGDYGLFQINRCNFTDIANHFGISVQDVKNKIYEPAFSCDCSMYILNKFTDTYGCDDYHTLLMYYNMGPGNAKELISKGTMSTDYTQDIIQIATSKWNLDSVNI